ncbi:MAG: hypothetical protein IPO72_13575 [Saprospiraceae bacterium]|nr:hypothetical protein [Candidatus Vicinibacter affinis]MBK7692945.1 hypothetical protein [Candidatus Vicinibacter affinis]MBK9642265.1 hypothetical protein [Candidatus Vicinibacter affinis]HQX43311.1 poly(R)-hydroxyalkanoic acid synthase subunit PhaE [Saprospiraceae bacterium]
MEKSNRSSDLIENVIDTHAKTVDQIVENSKKLTKDLPLVNETIDKSHKLFQQSVSSQKELAIKASETFEKTSKQMNNNAEMAQNFFKQWLENQMTWAKTNFNQPNIPAFNSDPKDWMANWQKFMGQNPNPFASMMNGNPFFSMMQNNPFMNMNSMQNNMNENVTNWSQFTKQYLDMMNQSYNEWVKQFSNLTAADTFKGMSNMTESLNKFFELWMPMFKSIQDKSFTAESFMNSLNPEKYKAFVDSFFKFMPEEGQKMMEQMNTQFVQYMKHVSEAGFNGYSSMKSQMQQMNGLNQNPYSNAWDMYHNWRNAINEAVSPLTKLTNENGPVKNVKIWNDINDLMVEFNIKNNELQYLVYQNGLKVMDRLSDKVANQLKEGKTIDSFVKLYQDWLVTGDEVFTELFNGDQYSKLMTEVSSLQMRLKKDIDDQMESLFLVNMPVATRTEMDEVYKSIYDLKKMYRNLEKMFSAEKTEQQEKVVPETKTSKKK